MIGRQYNSPTILNAAIGAFFPFPHDTNFAAFRRGSRPPYADCAGTLAQCVAIDRLFYFAATS